MQYSRFGQKLTSHSGILQLMDDLGKALSTGDKISLGGGNPAQVPAMESVWRREMQKVMTSGRNFEKMLGNYTTPQGDAGFVDAIVALFTRKFGWDISAKNIAVLGGSQTTFYFLFNLLAGEMVDGTRKKILFPLIPEYIGYTDQGIAPDLFTSIRPTITHTAPHRFKYGVDFDSLSLGPDIAAVAVSRPTNPTGNVITDGEVRHLIDLTRQHEIPLILDNAYGLPFPQIVFSDATPLYDSHVIYVMSLSKLGLPSTRTSIVIAPPEIVQALSSLNAIISLSTSTTGQYLTRDIIASGEILELSSRVINPYYKAKRDKAVAQLSQSLRPDISWHLHEPEGALFLWLWCENMPITAMELYERLKKRNVIVVPGEYFFPGDDAPWKHKSECIRITYSSDDRAVQQGLQIIADEINSLYSH